MATQKATWAMCLAVIAHAVTPAMSIALGNTKAHGAQQSLLRSQPIYAGFFDTTLSPPNCVDITSDVDDSAVTDAMTIDMMVKAEGVPVSGSNSLVMYKESLNVYLRPGNLLKVHCFNQNSNSWNYTTGNIQLTEGAWHSVRFVKTPTMCEWYVDGVRDTGFDAYGDLAFRSNSVWSNTVSLGCRYSLYFSGSRYYLQAPSDVKDVAIYASAILTDGATATGDPHLQNVHGERFDLMEPGKHVLINIPRGATPKESSLRVQAAAARQLGGQCADMYFTEINITGSWAHEKHPGGYRYTSQNAAPETGKWMALGKVEVKVVNGQTETGAQYLNFLIKHLGRAGVGIGGLLGEDDHEAVSATPADCAQHMSLTKLRARGRNSSAASIAAGTFA